MGAHRFVAAPIPARLAGGRHHRGVHDLGQSLRPPRPRWPGPARSRARWLRSWTARP